LIAEEGEFMGQAEWRCVFVAVKDQFIQHVKTRGSSRVGMPLLVGDGSGFLGLMIS